MKDEYRLKTLHIAFPMKLYLKIKEHRLLNGVNEITTELWADYIEELEARE